MLSMLDAYDLIEAKYTPLEFLDMLDISFRELIEKFRDEISDNWEDVIDSLNE